MNLMEQSFYNQPPTYKSRPFVTWRDKTQILCLLILYYCTFYYPLWLVIVYTPLIGIYNPRYVVYKPYVLLLLLLLCNVKKHPTPLHIALGLLIKTQKIILNHLFDYSVTCNYDEVRRFRKSAAIDARESCPAGYVRGLIQVIADTFNLDLRTPNGKADTQSLATVETYPMFSHNNDSQESDEFEWIKWKQMSDPIPDNEFPITHYNGAEEPPLAQVPQAELP